MAYLTNDLDMIPRYAPSRVYVIGNGKAYDATVNQYVSHPPGNHPKGCPLVSDCTALELKTEYGSRWFGCVESRINSELRMIVIGTNPRDEVRMKWEVCKTV